MDIQRRLTRRAEHHLRQTHLIVDYYRIRRRISLSLPITERPHFEYPIRGYTGYPWHTWLLWDLEERINALGYAAELTGEEAFRHAAARDLVALAGWHSFDEREFPHLAPGHALRTLVLSARRWASGDERCVAAVAAACHRVLDETRDWVAAQMPGSSQVADLLAAGANALHNIRVIAAITLAMAAHHVGDAAAEQLTEWSRTFILAVLEAYRGGSTEGVGYDGYILDFVADWLAVVPKTIGEPVRSHQSLPAMLEQSIHLACPGTPESVARLSDVEPVHMPFHLSAHAKIGRMGVCGYSRGYLERCDQSRLRSDGLAAMSMHQREEGATSNGVPRSTEALPEAGIGETNYTVTLRSGHSHEDLAVVVSSSTSEMSHLHEDRGSLVIGRSGVWFVEDPGYQQYLKTAEREYTTGLSAHNRPVVDGVAPRRAATRHRAHSRSRLGRDGVTVDLSSCYAAVSGIDTVRRSVFREGRDAVLVADEFRLTGVHSVSYAWHGSPEAAWGVEQDAACIYQDGLALYIRCSHGTPAQSMIDRLPGSRGGLTLRMDLEIRPSEDDLAVVWWSFLFEDISNVVGAAGNKRSVQRGPTRFVVPREEV